MSDYKADLLRDLKDLRYAAEYVTAAYADSPEAFLVALRDVTDSQKGMTKLALEAGVDRVNLYRMLSEDGNPRLCSLSAVLEAIGFGVRFEPTSTGGPEAKSENHSGERQNIPKPIKGMPHKELLGGTAALSGYRWIAIVPAAPLIPEPIFVSGNNSQGTPWARSVGNAPEGRKSSLSNWVPPPIGNATGKNQHV